MGISVDCSMAAVRCHAVLFCILVVLAGSVEEEESTNLNDGILDGSASAIGAPDLGEGKVKDSSSSGAFQKTWYQIPYFVLTHMSHDGGKVAEEACKQTCESKPMCRSFSWKESTSECIWSLDAIHFDPEFDFFAKTDPSTGAPFTYYEFLGVKYQESDSKGFSKQYKDLNIHQCRAKCDKEPAKCMSFSYRARGKFCQLSGEGLHYDSDWVYYERDVASIPRDWKMGSTKEKSAKMKFKGQAPISAADKQEEGKEMLKTADKEEATADAKVESLKAKLADAEESARSATSSADKEVAKLEVKKAKAELETAKKTLASAQVKVTSAKAESHTSEDDPQEAATEADDKV